MRNLILIIFLLLSLNAGAQTECIRSELDGSTLCNDDTNIDNSTYTVDRTQSNEYIENERIREFNQQIILDENKDN